MRRSEFSHRSFATARSGRRKLIAVCVVALILFVTDSLLGGILRTPIQSGAFWIGNVVSSTVHSLSIANIFRTRAVLQNENDALSVEVMRLRDEIASLQVIRDENQILRSLAGVVNDEKGLIVPVVSSFRASPYGTFSIGKGEGEGIRVGDYVYTGGGFLVGVVTDVQSSISTVKGILVPGRAVDVTVRDSYASAIGEGGGNARFSLPKGIEVRVGDVLYAPEFGNKPIATVARVMPLIESGESLVFAALPANLNVLRYVVVSSQ